ncbi:Annexin [Oesophagostomum dentatum]|uniref:Annexin n=1 Tax=Oesophagostomum dentatum TaxID=61180 RepID=A0A0B1TIM7_OESDE|nr:Annexin [Oesophagostomum dentatum]
MSLKTFILSGIREVLEDKFGYCPGGKDTLIPPHPSNINQQPQNGVTRIYPALPQEGGYSSSCPYPIQPDMVLPRQHVFTSTTTLPKGQEGVLYFEQKGLWVPGTLGTPSILPVPNFNASEDAKKLRKALNGNNKLGALSFLCAHTNWQRQEISIAFRQEYGEDLITDLISQLNSEYEDMILALMEPSAVYDAKQLHKAIQGLSTKDSMLFECMTYMTSRSDEQFAEIRKRYKELYHRDLRDELSDDKNGSLQSHLASLCAKGRTEHNSDQENYKRAQTISGTEHHHEKVELNSNDKQRIGAGISIISEMHHDGETLSMAEDGRSKVDMLCRAREIETSLLHREGTVGNVLDTERKSSSSCSNEQNQQQQMIGNPEQKRETVETSWNAADQHLKMNTSASAKVMNTGEMQSTTSTGEVRATTEKSASEGGYSHIAVNKIKQLSQIQTDAGTITSSSRYSMQMQTTTNTGGACATTEKSASGNEYRLAVDKSGHLSQLHTGTDTAANAGGYGMQMQTTTSGGEIHTTTEKSASSGGSYQNEMDKSPQLSQLQAGSDITAIAGGHSMQMETKANTGEVQITTEKTTSGDELANRVHTETVKVEDHRTDVNKLTSDGTLHLGKVVTSVEQSLLKKSMSTGDRGRHAEVTKSKNTEIPPCDKEWSSSAEYFSETGSLYSTHQFHVKTQKISDGGERRIVTAHYCIADERRTQPHSHRIMGKISSANESSSETDEKLFNEILASNNFAHLQTMFDEYQKETKQSIENAIDSQFDGYIRDGLLAAVGVVRNRPGYFAKVLHDTMESHDRRDDDLMRLIVSRSEYDMVDIRKQFQDMYKVSLEDMINAKYTGIYKEVLTTLVSGNRL